MFIRPSCLLVAAFALFASAVSSTAYADETSAGADEIGLANGGMLRGTIIALEPDKQVIILLAPMNEPRTIPWADIGKVERNKYAPAPIPAPIPAPTQSSAPVPAPLPAPIVPVGPRIHIDADAPGVALRRSTKVLRVLNSNGNLIGVENQFECRAPCDKVIDARKGEKFFFGGEGFAPSNPFEFDNLHGDVTAQVSVASRRWETAGDALMGIGIPSVIGGGMLLGFDLLIADEQVDTTNNTSFLWNPVFPLSLIGVGAVMITTSIIFNAVVAKSRYTLSPKDGRPAATGLHVRFEGGVLRF